MKLTKFANLMALGIILTLAASGCRHSPQGTRNIPGSPKAGVSDLPPGTPIPGEPSGKEKEGIPSNPPGSHDGWTEDATVLAGNTVHFAFDSSVVSPAEKPNVTAAADYLKANSAKAVKIEGHCDERGTEEYNRSLGDRRALALREQLVSLGVDPTRVDTVTLGKDRPLAEGHDESAWKQNRRGVFVVLTPPAK